VTLYPQQKRTLDQALARTLLPIPDGSSETQGLSLGQTVATLILETRRNDGATTQGTENYQPGKAAGQWRPTPPNFRAAFLPLWGNVKPFAIAGADQFRLDQPPALNSRKYAQEVAQVRRLGELDSRVRRLQQTLSAQFWAGIGGPVYWNQLAAQIADRSRSSLAENARLFALLNLAEADAGITAWKIKYTDQRWRPIDAIRRAGTDGNGLTQPDRNWTPLLETPSHPDYVSAHSIFSSAAATILSSQWGDRVKFTTTSSSLPGVQRTYRSFQAAAQEAGMSRIYGGIHFMSANRAGLQSGRAIANTILQNFL
jgi:membrane-associated phospholipid phosphatase